jgi:hypothetical protein
MEQMNKQKINNFVGNEQPEPARIKHIRANSSLANYPGAQANF